MKPVPQTTHPVEPSPPTFPRDVSLDPGDPAAYRAMAHRALDIALDALATVRDGPVWVPVPEPVKAALTAPAPVEPEGAEEVLDAFRRLVLPYGTGNVHPRFWGWVHGTGTVGGVVSELLTAAMNANVGGRDHGAVYVERQVIGWCRDLFGLPASASGLLVSGTSLATVIALTVARDVALRPHGLDVRRDGLHGGPALTAYASREAHVSVRKAMELLGLGSASLRSVPVDETLRMDTSVLRAMITADRAAGRLPFCVVATAGTVNTGAIDDLAGTAAVCQSEGLWLHVDGAFGALVRLAPALAHLVDGIEQADSIAFDFHKWLHVPYDAGCVLIRRGDLHLRAFSTLQDYLAAGKGLSGGEPWFCDLGPELSRSFRALRVWWTLKEHGLRRLGEKIHENCEQARYLRDLVTSHPELALAAPVPLNIVCFRYVGDGRPVPDALGPEALGPEALGPEALDRLQTDIVAALHLAGTAAPSTTRIDGRTVIRVAITNHRSQRGDFDALVDAVLAHGRALAPLAAP